MEIQQSAREHGIVDEDAMHALQDTFVAARSILVANRPGMLIVGLDRPATRSR